MSRMKCMESSIVLTPKDICSREKWSVQGAILSRDLVHLSIKGYKLVGDCVRRAVAWTSQNVGTPEEEGRGSIPSEILFSTWVMAFWTSCGYDFPVPMGGKAHVFCERRLKTNQTTSLNLSQCTAYRHLLGLTPKKLDRPKACRTG